MKEVISIKRYRGITKDQISSDDKIRERLQYLGMFCRNIIKIEIEKVKAKK